MSKRSDLRYDLLYRVIDEKDELHVIEGEYKPIFDRIKRINNLGVISEILEIAKYPKYEHAIGTIYQTYSLLDITGEVSAKKMRCLKLASIFLHLAHLPFTYSTEGALILARSLHNEIENNQIERYVDDRIQKVLSTAKFNEDRKKVFLQDRFYLQDYRSLYSFLSAALLLDRWDSLKRLMQKHSELIEFQNLDNEDLETVLKNLVDPEDIGYQRLRLADKADFVQRDALYFGTVRLDISPKHLYSELASNTQIAGTREESLIDANLRYLNERFYNNDDIVCFSRLYEKIVASLLITEEFKEDWLSYDDDQFKRLICENLNKENTLENLDSSLVDKTKALFEGNINFEEVFRLEGIQYRAGKDVLEIEGEVVGVNDRPQLLSYPFVRGILATVDILPGLPIFYDSFLIRIFQDRSKKNLGELLNNIKVLSGHLSEDHAKRIREQTGNQLSSTKNVRINDKRIIRSIAEAIQSIEGTTEGFLDSFGSTIFRHPAFAQLLSYPQYLVFGAGLTMRLMKEDERYTAFAKLLLYLPLYLFWDESVSAAIKKIRDALLDLIPKKPEDVRGYYFEAICALERLLAKKAQFQFLVYGMVITDPQKPKGQQDTNEFDIVELFLNDRRAPECWIHSCTVIDKPKSHNREQLLKLMETIHDTFRDATIRTIFWTPKDKGKGDWSPHYERGPIYNGLSTLESNLDSV
jgi:HD superfamily phosphohydrolase